LALLEAASGLLFAAAAKVKLALLPKSPSSDDSSPPLFEPFSSSSSLERHRPVRAELLLGSIAVVEEEASRPVG
jgi:hypothetical protein